MAMFPTEHKYHGEVPDIGKAFDKQPQSARTDSQRIDYLENQLRDLKRALRDGLLHTVRWVEKNGD